MKKLSVLAVAVAAAFAASAASAATVYDKDGTTLAVGGQIEFMAGKYYFGNASDDTTTRDRARVTMSGRTQLTDGIAAYAYNEWEINHKADSTEDQKVNARQQYLGVDFGKFGKVQAGRYTDPFQYATQLVDVLDEVGVWGGQNERNSGHLSYMWSGFGFDAGVSYQFAVDNYRGDVEGGNMNVDSGFSVYAGYKTPSVLFGPISIRAAYLYLNGQDVNDGAKNIGSGTNKAGDAYNNEYVSDIKAYDVGLAWGTNGKGLYIATHYNVTKANVDVENGTIANKVSTVTSYGTLEEKAKAWESVVTYGFDNGVRLGASYHRVKLTETNTLNLGDYEADDNGTKKWVELIADYNVTPNFKVWVEGIIDAGSTDATIFHDGYGKITSNHDVNSKVYNADKGNGHNTVLVGARYVF